MPRSVAGVYTLPGGINPVVDGTTIQSTWANPTLADVAQGVTDSLDRSGRGAMLAPLKVPDGTALLPSMTFSSDPTTGFYRYAATAIGMTANGVLQAVLDGNYLNAQARLGIRVTTAWAWNNTYSVLDVGTRSALTADDTTFNMRWNSYVDATLTNRAKYLGVGAALALNDTGLNLFSSPSVAALAAQTFSNLFSVNQNGFVSAPLNPCVCAQDGGTQIRNSSSFTIMNGFTTENVDTGSNWNGSSTFTVPATGGGIYEMRYTGVVSGAGGPVTVQLRFYKNAAPVGLPVDAYSANGSDWVSVNNQLMLSLVAGDTIAVYAARSGGAVDAYFDRSTVTIRKVQ